MTARHVNASLVAASLVGLALGVRLVAAPLVSVPALAPGGSTTVARAPKTKTETVILPGSMGPTVVAHDPFRVMRRPSAVAYEPARLAQPTTSPHPKPALALVGLVWDRLSGATALIEGLPGVDGPRAVRLHQRIAGLRVKAITFDHVVIAGLDTTWSLTVREPWQ